MTGTETGLHPRLPSFDELARRSDDELDVALGAALVSRDTYDGLDVHALLRDLASLGASLGGPASAAAPLRDRVVAVSERFTSLGFRANADDYYDPRNILQIGRAHV